MESIQLWGYALLAAYVLGMLVIGWSSRRRASKGVEQYYLGGRGMPPFIVAVTFVLASTSAGAFMGEPALAYTSGMSALWATMSIVVGLTFATILFSSRLRAFTVAAGAVTVPGYLGARYDSTVLRVIIAVVITIFYTITLISMYRGASILFNSVLGVPVDLGLVVFTVVVAIYVSFGGFRAITWTSTIQGLPMILFSIVLIAATLIRVDGLSGLSKQLNEIDASLTNLTEPELFTPMGIVGLYVFWTVVFVSNPHLSTKFMALRDSRRTTMRTFLLTILVLTAIINLNYLIGLGARVLMPNLAEPDFATIEMAIALLPPILAAVLMVGILAAIMSTIDSMLLSIGSSVAEDIVRGRFRPNASDRTVLFITRAVIVVVSGVVLAFLLWRTPDLLAIFLVIGMTGVGIAIAPPLVIGLFWRRATRSGAIASVLVGVPFYSVLVNVTDISVYAAALCGAVVSFGVMLGVSAFTKPPADETVETFRVAVK